MGLYDLTLPPGNPGLHIKDRTNGINADRRMASIILKAQKNAVGSADVPIKSAGSEHFLTWAPANTQEMHRTGDIAVPGPIRVVWILKTEASERIVEDARQWRRRPESRVIEIE